MTNDQVVEKFMAGESGKSGSMMSSGAVLYSYNLPIAAWCGDNIVVFGFTAAGGKFFSKTTSHHVGLLLRFPHAFAVLAATEGKPHYNAFYQGTVINKELMDAIVDGTRPVQDVACEVVKQLEGVEL